MILPKRQKRFWNLKNIWHSKVYKLSIQQPKKESFHSLLANLEAVPEWSTRDHRRLESLGSAGRLRVCHKPPRVSCSRGLQLFFQKLFSRFLLSFSQRTSLEVELSSILAAFLLVISPFFYGLLIWFTKKIVYEAYRGLEQKFTTELQFVFSALLDHKSSHFFWNWLIVTPWT